MDAHHRAESLDSWSDSDASPTEPLFPSSSRSQPLKFVRQSLARRRWQLVAILCILPVLSVVAVVVHVMPGSRLSIRANSVNKARSSRLSVLRTHPTARFRDNLRNDTKYITSWISAGWTNDVMTYANLIYLGLITKRVPILHTFLPSHVGPAPQIPFSEVFDIDYLSDKIGLPVLEWSEVKDPHTMSEEVEQVGCWSIWQAVQRQDPNPRVIYTEHQQGLDISFTAAPPWIQKWPGHEHDKFARFWDVATLAYAGGRMDSSNTPQPSRTGALLEPDEQLACFDYLYYTCASLSDEYNREHSPAWRDVLTHFRFTPRLQELADQYLRRMFGVAESDPIPPYITIHARRGDFAAYCGYASLTAAECFPHMEDYARGVAGIRKELEERLGISPTHIVMVSDEKDPLWWDVVKIMGWYTTDHDAVQTAEKYGAWYPVFIDAVIQASGVGLLGSPGSTMSIIAGRRVVDWQNGAYHNVPWAYSHTPGGSALL